MSSVGRSNLDLTVGWMCSQQYVCAHTTFKGLDSMVGIRHLISFIEVFNLHNACFLYALGKKLGT